MLIGKVSLFCCGELTLEVCLNIFRYALYMLNVPWPYKNSCTLKLIFIDSACCLFEIFSLILLIYRALSLDVTKDFIAFDVLAVWYDVEWLEI